jgi:transposase InsO family protein
MAKGSKNRRKELTDELIKKASRLLKGEKLSKEQSEAYALHSKQFHKYKRLKIHVNKRNAQWSIDLADLNRLSGYNNHFRYMLVCVDVYSRYTFVKLLKTKSAGNVAKKFEELLLEHGVPKKVHSDEGTEFSLIKSKLALRYGFTLSHTFIGKPKRCMPNDLFKH